MIECSSGLRCNGWIHPSCMNLTPSQVREVKKQENYACVWCKSEGFLTEVTIIRLCLLLSHKTNMLMNIFQILALYRWREIAVRRRKRSKRKERWSLRHSFGFCNLDKKYFEIYIYWVQFDGNINKEASTSSFSVDKTH
jgi:hypothetical protein